MKILSLFDGISCARVALDRAGIPVEAYYASEIDKYAMQISAKNWPDIIQLGSVTGLNSKVLRLSGVYDTLKQYDSDIQNKFPEREMLYWLNEDFSISATIRTQIADTTGVQTSPIQRIEEIRLSKRGVGDIVKTQALIRSRASREDGYIEDQEVLLQCGEWGYVYRSNARNPKENIDGFNGSKVKTREHREDTNSGNFTMGNTSVEKAVIETNKEGNVGAKEQGEVLAGAKEQKERGASTTPNRKEYARSKVQGVSFHLQAKYDDETITEREWLQLSIHKEMEATVVETGKRVDIFIGHFGLMCGGSPCQDLSIAKKDRKGLSGDRSGLFLENVASMPKEAKQLITETLGVEPIMIDAALVSAQRRKRLFWTNIPNVGQPEDRGILLKDILEDGDTVINPKLLNFKGDTEKSMTITATAYKEPPLVLKTKSNTIRTGGRGSGAGDKHDWESVYQYRRTYWRETKGGKVPTLTANMGTGGNNVPYIIAPNGKKVEIPEPERSVAVFKETRTEEGKKSRREARIATGRDTTLRSKDHKKYSPDYTGKSNCLVTGDGVEKWVAPPEDIRKLTPIECERLQSLPDGYTEGVSNTQRYKALGNAFNVEVIAHILSFI